MEFADWKWIRTMLIWSGILAVGFLIYPIGWGMYWQVNLPEVGLMAVVNRNAKAIEQLVSYNRMHEGGQRGQFEDIQKQLKGLSLLYGLATVSEAGDEITAAINVGGPAVRLDEGQELWVTNRSDESKTKIKVRVSGSFTAGDRYLIRLSKEAGIAIEASKNEIQVVIEPIEEEEAD